MASRKRPAAAMQPNQEGPSAKTPRKSRPQGLYEQYKGSSIPESRLPRKQGSAKSLKVIVWNVGGLRSFLEKRSKDLKRLVDKESPSVFGFMEHRLQKGQQVAECVEKLSQLLPDYHIDAHSFHCCEQKKGYSGVVMFWKKSLTSSVKQLKHEKLEPGSTEGRTVVLELEKMYIVLCYVLNSGDGLGRLSERLTTFDPNLRKLLQGLARRKPVALLGDLNVAHQDADIWNLEAPHIPKSASTTPEERESFGRLLSAGFVDAFNHQHPEARGAFTYWSVRAGNKKWNRGLRLDYTVVSQKLTEQQGTRLLDAFHLPHYAPAGDHCPIGATFEQAV
nr:DNA-(apurinic or apyrimidinic site) lyase [Crypthecodinium cohnii]